MMAALMCNVSRGFVILGEQRLLLRGRNGVSVDWRRRVRALRRRPVAVLYPDDERVTHTKTNDHIKQKLFTRKETESDSKHPHKKDHDTSVSKTLQESSYIKDKVNGLRFEKAAAGDQRLAKVVSVARSRAFRDKEGKILLEGRRLICDALAAGASPQTLFFSAVERLQELPLDDLQQASLIKVRFDDMKTWSDLVTPQGVIAIFSKPDASRLAFPKDARLQSVPLFLICDNMRDAGNLGTILRCAAAAGCERVLLTRGCVDAWEPKVLRAAMGAHFRLPIFPHLDWDEISGHLPRDVTVHVADNCSSLIKHSVSEAVPKKTEGVSSDEYIDSDSESSDEELSFPRVKPRVYHENWAQRSTALVIGGETHGVSLDALRLAEKTDGQRLFVPMAPGMESLNSAMAASILLFEGRRQLLKLKSYKERRRARSKINSCINKGITLTLCSFH